MKTTKSLSKTKTGKLVFIEDVHILFKDMPSGNGMSSGLKKGFIVEQDNLSLDEIVKLKEKHISLDKKLRENNGFYFE